MGRFELLYLDSVLVAIDKPHSMLIHRTPISHDRVFVLQELREQLGRHVFPVHRLDRATSGVLLFALSPECAAHLSKDFAEGRVQKKYVAIVRGFTQPGEIIDHPLKDSENGKSREAITEYRTLGRTEIEIPVRPYPSARYSLIEVLPRTGRRHQIRRHLKHIFHPIIGDVRYGDGKHNQLFRENYGINRLLLHACRLSFNHPETGNLIQVESPLPAEMLQLKSRLRWDL